MLLLSAAACLERFREDGGGFGLACLVFLWVAWCVPPGVARQMRATACSLL
eukprot:GDKH01010650.1.p2 GENE.GDKH01010650.1~~GDKH01010650.1.p2  ORF type:complete len:51 (-),score=5.63 GDKH01010650.1:35-187(-)